MSHETTFCPDCCAERHSFTNGKIRCPRHAAAFAASVLLELEQSAGYWSEYDVPLGIVDRIREARSALAASEVKP